MRKWIAAALSTYLFFFHHWQVSWYTSADIHDVWMITFSALPLFYVLGPSVSWVTEMIFKDKWQQNEPTLFSIQLIIICIIVGLLSNEFVTYAMGTLYIVAYRCVPWFQSKLNKKIEILIVYTPLLCFLLSILAFFLTFY